MKHQSLMVSVISFLFALSSAFAGTWTGKGGDNKWSNPNNWKNTTVPADGEQLTIKGGDFEIEIGPDEEVFVGQVLVGTDGTVTTDKVRFYGGGKMTRHTTATSASYLYPGVTVIVDGIDWNTKAGGFSIQKGATLELRSGRCCCEPTDAGTAFMYDESRLIVRDGEFSVNRFSRSVAAVLELRGGQLCYQSDNGASGVDGGIIFTGGTLICTTAAIKSMVRMPTGDGSKTVVRNTADAAVAPFETDGSYMVRGTVECTNGWTAASETPSLRIDGSVNVGGRGSWLLACLYETGGSTTRAKLSLDELTVGNVKHQSSGSIVELFNGAKLRALGADIRFSSIHCYWHGLLDVDTTDFADPSKGRLTTLWSSYPQSTVGLRTFASGEGKGEVWQHFPNDEAVGKRHFDSFEVGAGTKLTLETAGLNNPCVRVGSLKVGAGATLSITGKCLRVTTETRTAEVDPTATVEYRTCLTPVRLSRYTILDMGPYGDASTLNITTPEGLPAGWRIAKDGPVAYLTDDEQVGNPDDATATTWTWIGQDGGCWTNVQNWSINKYNTNRTKYPGANQTVNFCGLGSTVITNDTGAPISVAKIVLQNGSGVVRFRGDPIQLTQSARSGSSMALQMDACNRTAAIFESKVIGTTTAFFAPGATCGYFSFLGGLEAKDAMFVAVGETRFGGTSEWRSTDIYGGRNSKDSAGTSVAGVEPSISLVTNAVVTVTAQTNDFAYTGTFSLRIDEGAKLRFTNPGNNPLVKYRPTFAFYNTTIHGLMDIGIPFYVVGDQEFYGRGAIALGCVRGDATGSGRVCIGDGLTLYSAGFDTVSAENPDSAVSVLAESKATIGATCDWTYGPAAGVTTATTAADRALRTAGVYAPLTIDTEDPETGVGHTITFVDPILAKGDVTKTGAGTLVFDTVGNTVDYRFTVEEGTLALGPTLAANTDWTDVLTAKEFVGLDACLADGFKMKIVVNGDGTATLKMKPKGGMMLLVR